MSDKEEKSNSWFKSLLTAILIIGPSLYFGNKGMPTEMGLSIVAGAITAGFLNIEKIELLKGAGFEARMKAEVKKAVDEAYATIDQLKALGKPVVLALLKIMVYHSRIGGLSDLERQRLFTELEEISKTLSIANDPEISDIKRVFHRFKTWDFFQDFVSKFKVITQDHTTAESLKNLVEFKTTNYPSEETILGLLGNHADNLRPEISERLEDYLYYRKNKKLRCETDPYS